MLQGCCLKRNLLWLRLEEKKSKGQVCLESLRVFIDKCGKNPKMFRKTLSLLILVLFLWIWVDLNLWAIFIDFKIQIWEKIKEEGFHFRVYALLDENLSLICIFMLFLYRTVVEIAISFPSFSFQFIKIQGFLIQ